MNRNCDNCSKRFKYNNYFCVKEQTRPIESLCRSHNFNCVECGCSTQYIFNKNHYCEDCLLSEFEVQEYTVTHYYHGGEYIGSDDDMNEVINNLDDDIEVL